METLIRFDWAMKQLLRNKANFDILEGFLSAVFQEEVTVTSLLESEGNQQDETDKFNRVDLVVENAKRELILIEVQVQAEQDFFQRISYGVSTLLTEYLKRGQPYKDIKKVVSVSVTYFDLGLGDDYLYYGSTQFIGRHTGDTLRLTAQQYQMFGTREVRKLFPEHYLIRVKKFPDTVHEAVDEWIYMLKHSEVKPDFRSKHIQTASEKLRLMRLNDTQRKAYDRYMENVSYRQSLLWSSYEEGRQEGIEQGKLETARTMLHAHVPIDTIIAYTGVSREEVETLQRDVL
ncbi:hypothetical protein CSB45_00135 [candidate division KSB3 bacterium]|uniref:Rpn family recombination-promoting nuclease/putative transposase n=1 Tax=candidate division KSB3 bacterium TaxID=2044937 RepID=A0A2G6EFS6_9BACT|nr:MAG: hypothetical protein CSB45_00135 [candidate division KSB3 bacterium]PIE31127.1 MAG: hypothetical protein CSA57_00220 [candidate division KSB3 bacterium]